MIIVSQGLMLSQGKNYLCTVKCYLFCYNAFILKGHCHDVSVHTRHENVCKFYRLSRNTTFIIIVQQHDCMHRVNSRLHERREHHHRCRLFEDSSLNYIVGPHPELMTKWNNYYYTNCRLTTTEQYFCRVINIKSPHAHRIALIPLKDKLLLDVEIISPVAVGKLCTELTANLTAHCEVASAWSRHP